MKEHELILTSLLNCRRIDLYTKDASLTLSQREKLKHILRKRKTGYPLQYLLGKTEFFGINFRVKENVFIPRPETELLIEETIFVLQEERFAKNNLSLLEIGTGSGNIAVTLAKLANNLRIVSMDINKDAIDLACENALLNRVSDKICFLHQDLFTIKDIGLKFDIILSNPPYIKTKDLKDLPKEVGFEPVNSLDAGPDGLIFYKEILKLSKKILVNNGMIIFEIGFNQLKDIKVLILKVGGLELVKSVKDYNGFDRIVVIKHTKDRKSNG